ncbi:MAG: hypothetical protein ABIR70_08720 [Bryobacteraceae bacterium]
MSSENLDPVLKKHLGRVEAPANLWGHVQGRIAAESPKPSYWKVPAFATAAFVVAIAGGWTMWQQSQAPQTVEAMAVAALGNRPEQLELRTDDAASIRKWVRANAGIDIPLPPKHSEVIRITGASVNHEGPRMAQVAYQVGEFRAALLVTKDPTGVTRYPKHDFRGSNSLDAARVTSWSLKGQAYTLAWTAPGEDRTACLLCHDQEPPMVPPAAQVN